jgi:hypothetical protein
LNESWRASFRLSLDRRRETLPENHVFSLQTQECMDITRSCLVNPLT